jgi:hypothetical protein
MRTAGLAPTPLVDIVINESLVVLPLLIRAIPSDIVTHISSKPVSARLEGRKLIDTAVFS